jgi:hypothetical protein
MWMTLVGLYQYVLTTFFHGIFIPFSHTQFKHLLIHESWAGLYLVHKMWDIYQKAHSGLYSLAR